MNKTAIRNFAIWARNKLIDDVQYKAGLMGVTPEGIKTPLPQSTRETQFFDIGTAEPYSIIGDEIKQRANLVNVINLKSYETDYSTAYKYIIEEVAYTWFNRLIAVRFMEVNDYLPSHIRVLSSESGKMEPDLVTTPFDADLAFTDIEKQEIIRLKNDNALDECFRLLFIKQCNALNEILPALFERTSDYTEVLLNISAIDKEGVVYHLVNDIPEEDFDIEKGGQIEIIGWMYQYYNTEPKNDAFAKSGKITKEEIPAVTQLFTPDWIVRYMVENSLGRIWVEGHPNDTLKSGWKYYLEEAEQKPNVQEKIRNIHKEYSKLKPEDIKFIDPCMGSGHILVYAFDVFMQIYQAAGYSERDAAKSILENNLYGLDIDDRAQQMAYFAVMMKARQYNRRILSADSSCHVYSVQDSNRISRNQLQYFGTNLNEIEKNDALNQITGLLDTFKDAKEYGSILNVDNYNWELLARFVESDNLVGQITFESIGIEETKESLLRILAIGKIMACHYEVVATNPPYMGSNGMSVNLNNYVKKHYPDSKADLFSVFIEKCMAFCKADGYISMITQNSWMFLASFEKVREKVLKHSILNMIHLGARAFEEISGEVVQTTSFVIRALYIDQYFGRYSRLVDYTNPYEKERHFLDNTNLYEANQNDFFAIPSFPIAYWVGNGFMNAFKNNPRLGEYVECAAGISTGDNDRYLKLWSEVAYNEIAKCIKTEEEFLSSGKKYAYCNKGGNYRKWYGNNDYVAFWKKSDEFHRNGATYKHLMFRAGITWSEICLGNFNARYYLSGQIFDHKSPGMFAHSEDKLRVYLGFLNSVVASYILSVINPTISTGADSLRKIPMVEGEDELRISELVKVNIEKSKNDWDSFETSWDFKKHPLI